MTDSNKELTKLRAEKSVLEREVVYLKLKLEEVSSSGWNPERMRKFRRMEHLFSRMTQVISNESMSPIQVVTALRELWKDESPYVTREIDV